MTESIIEFAMNRDGPTQLGDRGGAPGGLAHGPRGQSRDEVPSTEGAVVAPRTRHPLA